MIEDVILTTENCRYCLMCRHVCPVSHVTRLETFSPHGWGLTIASLRRGLLELDEEIVDVLYNCADCGTCRAHCITDQPLPTAIAAMRAEAVARGLAPAPAAAVHEKLKRWGNPHAEESPPPAKGQGQVALFVGDDAHFLGNGLLDSALQLLQAVGVAPVLVGIGRNNGYLASSLGYPETAAALIKETLDEVVASGAGSLLLLTPGDYYAFRQMREDRLDLDWPEEVTLQEVLTFLAGHLEAGSLGFKSIEEEIPYAYVDPTHSVRVTGRYEAPRLLLAEIMGPGIELFWRQERAHPVGNVALQYTQPHIANHLTYARLGDAVERGARLLITEDPGCLVPMQKHAGRFGLQVRDLYQLLAQHLS